MNKDAVCLLFSFERCMVARICRKEKSFTDWWDWSFDYAKKNDTRENFACAQIELEIDPDVFGEPSPWYLWGHQCKDQNALMMAARADIEPHPPGTALLLRDTGQVVVVRRARLEGFYQMSQTGLLCVVVYKLFSRLKDDAPGDEYPFPADNARVLVLS